MLTQPEKNLQEMTAVELDAWRVKWKDEAQGLFMPFVPALLSGYRMSYRQERTRRVGSIITGNVQIDTCDTVKTYNTSKSDFLHRMSIQVYADGEQVANLVLLYYPKIDSNGEWSDEKYLFARPGAFDWVSSILELIRDYRTQSQSEQAQVEEKTRQDLLKLLTKGIYYEKNEKR